MVLKYLCVQITLLDYHCAGRPFREYPLLISNIRKDNLLVHRGKLPLHCPLDWQVLLFDPCRVYPVLQV